MAKHLAQSVARSVSKKQRVKLPNTPVVKPRVKITPVKVGGGVVFIGTSLCLKYYHSKLKTEQEEIKKRVKEISVAKKEGGLLLDFVQLKVLYWNLYGLDGMNPVSRNHNDALFTFAPFNVNVVFCLMAGLIPFWAYHKMRMVYFGRKISKLSRKVKNKCTSRVSPSRVPGMVQSKCCTDPRRCMSSTLEPDTVLDTISMSRMYRYYTERSSEVAFLGVVILFNAAVGVGINLHDMKETEKMEQALLNKQWGLQTLEYDSTLNLLHVILSRRLDIFEEDLRIISAYVSHMTGQPTYWDVPSTYLHYSPLIIMQFLFNELDIEYGVSRISNLLGDLYLSFAASDPETLNGIAEWLKPNLEPYDIDFRNYLISVRIRQRAELEKLNLERTIDEQNRRISCSKSE